MYGRHQLRRQVGAASGVCRRAHQLRQVPDGHVSVGPLAEGQVRPLGTVVIRRPPAPLTPVISTFILGSEQHLVMHDFTCGVLTTTIPIWLETSIAFLPLLSINPSEIFALIPRLQLPRTLQHFPLRHVQL